MRARQFAPPAFVAALAAALALSVVPGSSPLPAVALAGTYAVANLTASFITGWKAPRDIFYLPLAFAALHLSYGAGFLCGLIRFTHRWSAAAPASLPSVHA
jgi:hypothetical protein